MRDRVNDEKSNKRTLVVMMGANLAKMYHAILVLGALVCHILFISHQNHPIAFIGLIPFVMLLKHVRKVMSTKDPKEFDPELKKVALGTFVLSILIWISFFINKY